MRTALFVGISILASFWMAGCSGGVAAEAPSATVSTTQQGPDTQVAKGGKVYNAPPAGPTGDQGYRIQPSNPNDKKFQADPKLAGGG